MAGYELNLPELENMDLLSPDGGYGLDTGGSTGAFNLDFSNIGSFGAESYDPSALNIPEFDLSKFGNEYSVPKIDFNAISTGDSTATGGSWMESFFGKQTEDGFQPGMGMYGLKAATGIANAWLGMKQYGLAKNQLKENKRQFNLNYDAQKNTTNAQLADRQRSRVAGSSGQIGVDEYMKEYGIA